MREPADEARHVLGGGSPTLRFAGSEAEGGAAPPWRFCEMTRDAVEEIIAWSYPDEYAFYDMSRDEAGRAEFRDAGRWQIVPLEDADEVLVRVTDTHDRLAGFFLFRGSPFLCTIGLGLSPGLTGRGLGESFVRAGLAFGERTWGVREYHLLVAAFNERALTVYTRVGFRETGRHVRDTFGESVEFVEMRRR